MKFFLLVVLLIIATASAKSGMPAPKMRMQKTAATDLVQKKVIGIRGGGMISRDAFVKFFTVSMSVFGLQFLFIPKTFWEMNFEDAPNKEATFLGRMMGILILGNCYMMHKGETELSYVVAAAQSVLMAYFGPYTATQTFKTKPAHKLPEILMPLTVALAAAAY